MSKSEILAALRLLQPDERREVRAKLDRLDGFAPDDWLGDGERSIAEKQLLEGRSTGSSPVRSTLFEGR